MRKKAVPDMRFLCHAVGIPFLAVPRLRSATGDKFRYRPNNG